VPGLLREMIEAEDGLLQDLDPLPLPIDVRAAVGDLGEVLGELLAQGGGAHRDLLGAGGPLSLEPPALAGAEGAEAEARAQDGAEAIEEVERLEALLAGHAPNIGGPGPGLD